MEDFVKTLMQGADLGVLTKRMVRDEYCKSIGKKHLTGEEKTNINQLVYSYLDVVIPRVEKVKEEEKCDDKENKIESLITPPVKKLSSTGIISPRKKPNTTNTRNLKIENNKTVLIEKKNKTSNILTNRKDRKIDKGNNSTVTNAAVEESDNITIAVKVVAEGKHKTEKKSSNSKSPIPSPKHSPRLRVDEVLDAVMKSDDESEISLIKSDQETDSDAPVVEKSKKVTKETDKKPRETATKKRNFVASKVKKKKSFQSDSDSDEKFDSEGSEDLYSPAKKKQKDLKSENTNQRPSRKREVKSKPNYFDDSDSEADSENEGIKSKNDSLRKNSTFNKKQQKKILVGSDSNRESESEDPNKHSSDSDSKSQSDSDFDDKRSKRVDKEKKKIFKQNSKKCKPTSDTDENSDNEKLGKKRVNKIRGQKRKLSSQTNSDSSLRPSKKYGKKNLSISDNSDSSDEEDNQPLALSVTRLEKKKSPVIKSGSTKSKKMSDKLDSSDSSNDEQVFNKSNSERDMSKFDEKRKKRISKKSKNCEGNIENQEKEKDNVVSFYGKKIQEKPKLNIRCDMTSSDSEDEIPLSSRKKVSISSEDENDDGEKTTKDAKYSDDESKALKIEADKHESSSSDDEKPTPAKKLDKKYSSSEDDEMSKKGNDDQASSTSDDEKPTPAKRKDKNDSSSEDETSKKESDDQVSSSSDEEKPTQAKKKDKNDSSSSEDEMPLSAFRKGSNSSLTESRSKHKELDSGSDSDVITNKPAKQKKSNKKKKESIDSEKSDIIESDREMKKKVKKKTEKKDKEKEKPVKKSPKESSEESTHVKNLKKICRASGILIRNTRELEGCITDNQKVKRLKDILSDAGMKGQPSMKKAERLKLKKEAAELDTENIIVTEKGRGRRNVNSVFSRRERSPSPEESCTPVKVQFSRLKDIFDSEGSSD